MIDAIWSCHLNPYTCGVAKFNLELARRLGVPCLVSGDRHSGAVHPLISMKVREWLGEAFRWTDWPTHRRFDLFLHDYHEPLLTWQLNMVQAAEHLYAGNEAIAAACRPLRPDIRSLWCPPTLAGHQARGAINVWTFGMAHKRQLPQWLALKALLERTPGAEDYTICSSMGIHEGHAWDEGFREAERVMHEIFGTHLRFLGFLADAALSVAIREANIVALFYDPALRANHTTAWAVMERGVPLITTLDAESPPELAHGVNLFELQQLEEWPTADERRIVRAGAAKVAAKYTWANLIWHFAKEADV